MSQIKERRALDQVRYLINGSSAETTAVAVIVALPCCPASAIWRSETNSQLAQYRKRDCDLLDNAIDELISWTLNRPGFAGGHFV
jgi:hypothetical protein